MPSKLSRDRHRLFAHGPQRFIEGFTNPYCIEYECAAGECAANLQSVWVPHAKRSRANRLMTGRCPSKSLKLRPEFYSLFLQNSFDFQKSATFKGLKSPPRMY